MQGLGYVYIVWMLVRLVGTGLWCRFAYVSWRGGSRAAEARLFRWLAVSVGAGYLFNALPYMLGIPLWAGYPLLALAFLCAPLIWLCAKAFFDDEFRLRPRHLAVAALAVAACFGTHRNLPEGGPFYRLLEAWPLARAAARALMPQLITIGFVLWTMLEVGLGRKHDLVESRLRFRRLFIHGMCFLAFFVTGAEITGRLLGDPAALFLDLAAVLLVGAGGWLFLQNLRDPDHSVIHELALQEATPEEREKPEGMRPEPMPEEARARLRSLLEKEKVFLRAGLDLEELSRLVKLPEYRVRRHINQVLGYRNFNQFLNHYRVEEAKRILRSEQGRQVPMYNLSQDLGFGSLTSFNRSFKDAVGMSPTEWRAGGATE